MTANVKTWSKYLDVAYPGRKPADWDTWLEALQANLHEPGRAEAAKRMMGSTSTLKEAGARLAEVRCPVLVIMGSDDSDFPDPEAEAVGIVGMLPAGLGPLGTDRTRWSLPSCGVSEDVAAALIPFLKELHHA